MSGYDAVVVGAGVLGAATALELAEAGLSVLVLDRGAPNREGSGTTAGNLHIQAVHTRRPGQAVPLDSEGLLPAQKAADGLWAQAEERLDADLEVRRNGGFMVAETAEQRQELRTKHVWERRAGLETELLDGDAARAALPLLGPTVTAATWCPHDGYANPLKAAPAYLAAAGRRGARVEAFTPVTGLERRGAAWRVRTPRGHHDTPVVVNTAGPWISDVGALAGVDLRMSPVAIQMHVTVRERPVLHHLVQHIGEGMSVKQVTAGNLLLGGGWPARRMDLDGRSSAGVAGLAGNVAQAARILPFLARLRLLRMWAGPLAATPDEMPVIGPVPGREGLYVAGGTYAFTFAPLWGETLGRMIRGQSPRIDVSAFAPDRLTAPAGGADTAVPAHTEKGTAPC
ncbi:NAD(P)/FAD-dependent oxidoreductase [Nocardiopsis flavescens]|uniref:Sarcosine oxidase subunit beta n=1 Tax=Nocardiopsis flavescens TaxID=758803 RepID=A0A1M6CYE6_9ACTN|nr:FAD-binding oxidoreductase [Nocardiopsis flavescens]SHI65999.1 sarcosine oxidase subunit beta [Nocardiopsis flavescens]